MYTLLNNQKIFNDKSFVNKFFTNKKNDTLNTYSKNDAIILSSITDKGVNFITNDLSSNLSLKKPNNNSKLFLNGYEIKDASPFNINSKYSHQNYLHIIVNAINHYINYLKGDTIDPPIVGKMIGVLFKEWELNFNDILFSMFNLKDNEYQLLIDNIESRFIDGNGDWGKYGEPIINIKANDKDTNYLKIEYHTNVLKIQRDIELLGVIREYDSFYNSPFNKNRGWDQKSLVRAFYLSKNTIKDYNEYDVDNFMNVVDLYISEYKERREDFSYSINII